VRIGGREGGREGKMANKNETMHVIQNFQFPEQI